MNIASVNPATGELLRSFHALRDVEIEQKLQRAAEAFSSYRRTPIQERARMIQCAADILEADRNNLGRLMTTEMGKPVKAAIEEVAKCARACRYYAEHAARYLADEIVRIEDAHAFIRYQPLGTVLAIMPWNFPFWQVFRFAAPALMAGNVALLKHASNVPQCALAVEQVFHRAGFPAGVFQTMLIGTDQVARLIADPGVVAVTLTGSDTAGSQVASAAGKQIKKTVLELGGSDPFIVMPSANLDAAVRTGVMARMINNGQSCIAAKRFIIAEEIAESFTSRFVERMRLIRIGDPMDEATELGPLATPEILDRLDEQVRGSIAAGARVLTGGKRIARSGNYYEPTVLVNIPENSPAYREELFGPVASLFQVRDAAEAVRLANDSHFGLAASVWTNDADERARFIDEIETGLVFVNAMVASDPRLPFGGVKRSGYGRELSEHGIREFVSTKTVWIRDE